MAKKYKLFIFYILVLFTVLIIIMQNGFDIRLPIDISHRNIINTQERSCFNKINTFCIAYPDRKKKIILIGDSHANSLFNDLRKQLKISDYGLIHTASSYCYYHLGLQIFNPGTKESFCTKEYFEAIKKMIEQNKDSVIVLMARLPVIFSEKYFDNNKGGVENFNGQNNNFGMSFIYDAEVKNKKDLIKQSINDLANNNKIILIYPVPEVGWNVQKLVSDNNTLFIPDKRKYLKLLYNNYFLDYQVYKKRHEETNLFLESFTHKNIFKIRTEEIFCEKKEKKCYIFKDNRILFYDTNHLSHYGTTLVNSKLLSLVKKID
jgi:hypothetical protein